MATVIGQPRRLASGFEFLEAPKWRNGRLYVSDVFGLAVHAIAPDGGTSEHCKVPARPAGQGFLPDGRHIVVSAKDQRLLDITDGTAKGYADLAGIAVGPLNDFAVDGQGRIYLGDFGYDYDGGEAPRPTRLYRVDLDGAVSIAAEGVNFPNGSVVLGGKLLVNETWEGRILSFDLEDGHLSNPKTFAQVSPRQPDGMCLDAEGAVWVGSFSTGEFLRVRPGGEITDVIAFPGSAISCTIGGPDGQTLYMTTFEGPVAEIATGVRKSHVHAVRVAVPGGPAW